MSDRQILVIDDEPDICELLKYNLENEGYGVQVVHDGEEGLRKVSNETWDLVVLDLMLPGKSGLDICREMKRSAVSESIPIIMLTAKGSETDKIVGLEIGADDYITKPFSPRELLARVKAVLRRAESKTEASSSDKLVLESQGLKMDLGRYEVSLQGVPLKLTNTEFRILQCLLEKPGHVFSRSQLVDHALGKDVSVVDRTIDVHVTNLRKKMGKDGPEIENIRAVGYRLKTGA